MKKPEQSGNGPDKVTRKETARHAASESARKRATPDANQAAAKSAHSKQMKEYRDGRRDTH